MAIPVLNDQQVKDLKRAIEKATNQNLIPTIYKNAERRLPTYDAPKATNFRNFRMLVDSVGTGVIVGEGYYRVDGEPGSRWISKMHYVPSDSGGSSGIGNGYMPPRDGKVYHFFIGMHGAPPWIGGTSTNWPPSGDHFFSAAPAGLTPWYIGSVKMTNPVQIWQPPIIGVPVLPAIPKEDFAAYAVYSGATFNQTAYEDFAHIPFRKIYVNAGWAAEVTSYKGDSAYPPDDIWLHCNWAEFDAEDLAGNRTMLCVKMRNHNYGPQTVALSTWNTGYTFTSKVWDHNNATAIVPIAQVEYYPATVGLSIKQHKTGTVYAVPLYDPHD